jgi:hypothetical protein
MLGCSSGQPDDIPGLHLVETSGSAGTWDTGADTIDIDAKLFGR